MIECGEIVVCPVSSHSSPKDQIVAQPSKTYSQFNNTYNLQLTFQLSAFSLLLLSFFIPFRCKDLFTIALNHTDYNYSDSLHWTSVS